MYKRPTEESADAKLREALDSIPIREPDSSIDDLILLEGAKRPPLSRAPLEFLRQFLIGAASAFVVSWVLIALTTKQTTHSPRIYASPEIRDNFKATGIKMPALEGPNGTAR